MQNFSSELHTQIKLRHHSEHYYHPHFHKEIEIIFMLEGSNNAILNGTTYNIPAGSVFLVSPNTIHSYPKQTSRCNSLLLIVDPHLLNGSVSNLAATTLQSPLWSDPEKKSFVWPMIQYAFEYGKSMSRDSFVLLLSSIISMIVDNIPTAASKQSMRIEQKILAYCQEHYLEPITTEQIAQALGVGRCHISRTFNNVLQTSFPTYINGLRLNDAIRLLVHTKTPIIDIALQSGFSSVRTFNRIFTEHFGFSPSQCRREHREKELLSYNFATG